jgi:hypothetical protein
MERFVCDNPSTLNDEGLAAASANSESETPGDGAAPVADVVSSAMLSNLSSP